MEKNTLWSKTPGFCPPVLLFVKWVLVKKIILISLFFNLNTAAIEAFAVISSHTQDSTCRDTSLVAHVGLTCVHLWLWCLAIRSSDISVCAALKDHPQLCKMSLLAKFTWKQHQRPDGFSCLRKCCQPRSCSAAPCAPLKLCRRPNEILVGASKTSKYTSIFFSYVGSALTCTETQV